ncbi:MAG: sulfurtransferase [Elainellaceae cyanobacterium]
MSGIAPIVSPSWLAEHLDDPQVAIADCRFSLMEPELGAQQYAAEHIPGAIYFDLNRDLSSPVQAHGGRHPLPDVEALAHKLGLAGISAETHVVAYDDSCFAFAARLWWLLRYLGHDRVSVLEGGLSGWKQAGLPLTSNQSSDRSQPNPTTFTPHVRSHMGVDIDQVKARKDQQGVVLVDSREGDRYRGEREPIDPIAGHIPGAVNYFWKEIVDETGTVLSPEAQSARWGAIANADEVLVYCGSGVTACVNLLSLELAKIYTGKLYAGSWSDWCSYQS